VAETGIEIRVYLDNGDVKTQFVASYAESQAVVGASLTAGYADIDGVVTTYYPTNRIAKIRVEADIILPPK
jgi:hypothetical protein